MEDIDNPIWVKRMRMPWLSGGQNERCGGLSALPLPACTRNWVYPISGLYRVGRSRKHPTSTERGGVRGLLLAAKTLANPTHPSGYARGPLPASGERWSRRVSARLQEVHHNLGEEDMR